jgi:peroxiredoxin
MGYIYDKVPDGAAQIIMAYLTPDLKAREYRPVLLDAGGKRYLPKRVMGIGAGRRGEGNFVMQRWRMDPNVLPAVNVASIGIEALTPESRMIAAREALERARAFHIEVLPWPQPGGAYPFNLTAIDGRKIRSEDLKGKVVLIDCWSANSAPSRWKMPELKALYEKWHQRGLEIVGVCVARDVESITEICKSEGLTWPQVFVSDDERVRELWQEASGIESISHLLIDQQGILQPDSPGKLEDKIAKLLASSSENPAAKPKP